MLAPLATDRTREAVDLLTEGFPERGRAFWETGLARLMAAGGNSACDYPPGHFWIEDGSPAGIVLTPASPRLGPDSTMRPLVNVSSWYLRPEFRWKGPVMLRSLFRNKAPVFTDLTPTPDVAKMLPAFGFRAINAGIVLQATPLLAIGSAQGHSVRPWQEGLVFDHPIPPNAVLAEHRDRGFLALSIEGAGSRQLIVLKGSRYRGLKAAQAVFIGSHRALPAALPSLGRWLATRGFLILQTDARPGKAQPAGFRPRGIWFATSDHFQDQTDHLGSEFCLFDL